MAATKQRTLPPRDKFKEVLGLKPLEKPAPPALWQNVTTVGVPAMTKFIPAVAIKLNKKKGRAIVRYIDPSVERLMAGLVEENVPAGNLRVDRLLRVTQTRDILKVLEARFVYFSDIWVLVERQPEGPASSVGVLHTDGKANLFKVVINGIVWLVGVDWDYWADDDG